MGSHPRSHLLHITDKNLGTEFLVDCGAEISLVRPFKSELRFKDNDKYLVAASGNKISTYGTRILHISFDGSTTFRWIFVVADTAHNISGVDFLHHFGLSLDFGANFIRQHSTSSCWSVHHKLVAQVSAPMAFIPDTPYLKLLSNYPDLTRPPNSLKPPKHDIVHQIVTHGYPCSARSRPLAPEKLAIVKEEIDFLLESGIISRSESQYSSRLHMVPKGNSGKFRLVGDYHNLNQQTVPDLYPTPFVQHLLHRLHGSTLFSKIDLVRAYHQIPLSPESRHKTTIICPFGLF